MTKNKFHIQISVFVVFILFIFSNYSCRDKCRDKICDHGYCIKGDCFCDEGYSGENCEIKESDKFAGLWSGQLICDFVKQPVRTIIFNEFYNPRKILLEIDNYSDTLLLRANIYEDSIFIENQFWEKIDSFIVNNEVFYDTTLNLIYPSTGKLRNDTLLEFDLKIKADSYMNCDMKLHKN